MTPDESQRDAGHAQSDVIANDPSVAVEDGHTGPSHQLDASQGRDEGSARGGVAMGLAAHGVWGLSPLLYKELASVSAFEIICFRGLSALVVSGGYLAAQGRMHEAWAAMRDVRIAALLALTSLILVCNWGVFVWGVAVERTLEVSFGYFISPIVSIALGLVVLRETLSRPQTIAVSLALVAICVQGVGLGSIPWLGLFLGVSFAAYAFVRKQMPVKATPGLFVESLFSALPMLGLLWWLSADGGLAFGNGAYISMLLILTGPLTAIPLILFSASARRLRLVTVGLLQFVTPSLHFMCGVFAFGEPLDALKLASFLILWVALAIVVHESWQKSRLAPAAA